MYNFLHANCKIVIYNVGIEKKKLVNSPSHAVKIYALSYIIPKMKKKSKQCNVFSVINTTSLNDIFDLNL